MSLHKSVSVIGLGWLGLPLAQALQAEGFEVKGSKSDPDGVILAGKSGVNAYELLLDPGLIGEVEPALFEADIAVINIPPRRRDDVASYHFKQMEVLISLVKASSIRQVLFISSTSACPELNREVTEADLEMPSKQVGQVLRKVEQCWMDEAAFETTILRPGGLIGGKRHPVNTLARRGAVPGKNQVNLIHRDDLVRIIIQLIQQEVWGEVFNCCAPMHPTREALYSHVAKMAGLNPPEFLDEMPQKWKVISPEKLIQRLNYTFMYPDPKFFPLN